MDDDPREIFPTAEAFSAWLQEHHEAAHGVWVVIAKKNSDVVTLQQQEAVMTALCWGWIDGIVRKRDEATYQQRFTRRRARSIWSQVNQGHVARLTAEGLMQPAGLAEVERAKADGRWAAAYAPATTIEVPPDLQAALATSPAAAAAFAGLNKQNRFAILFRVTSAVRPATRAKRVADLTAKLADGWLPYPPA